MKKFLMILSFCLLFSTVCFAKTKKEDENYKEIYSSFLKEGSFLDTSLHFGDPDEKLDPTEIKFTIYDIDSNGIPELLIFNGAKTYASSVTYVFTHEDNGIVYKGVLPGINNVTFYTIPNTTFLGIFTDGAHTGGFWTDYFFFKDGKIESDRVYEATDLKKNEEEGFFVFNKDPDTDEVILTETERTDNENLYKIYKLAEERNKKNELEFYDLYVLNEDIDKILEK